jgi:hypothetical protein
MSTTEPTPPRPATNAGAEALRYAWLESISQSRFGTERTNRISRELADLIVKAEQEAGRLALSQFTPERIAEALDGVLPRMAFIQYAEPLYGLDWEPDAYYLRVATEVLAALTEKPQETE